VFLFLLQQLNVMSVVVKEGEVVFKKNLSSFKLIESLQRTQVNRLVLYQLLKQLESSLGVN
jgi:hypothetical protein